MDSKQKILTLKYEKRPLTIIFSMLWLLFFGLAYKFINTLFNRDFNHEIFGIAAYVLTIYCIVNLLMSFFGQLTLIDSENGLISKSGLYFLPNTKKYDISKISGVKIKSDLKSSTYWDFGGFTVNAYNKSALAFNYNNKEIIQGKNLSLEDLEELKTWMSHL